MHIAYVLKKFPRASETFILNEILALQRHGVDVTVFSLNRPDDGVFHKGLAELQRPVIYLPVRKSDAWLTQLRTHRHLLAAAQTALFGEFADLLAAGRPDLWQVLGYGLDLALLCRQHGIQHLHAHFATVAAYAARAAAAVTGLPFSVTCHAKDIYRDGIVPSHFQSLLRASSFVVTVCEANRAWIETQLAVDTKLDLRVLYNGVDTAAFHPRFRKPPERPTVLAIGRLVEKKGFAVLLDALGHLRDANCRPRCVIIGDGEERAKLEAQVLSLQLDNVEFVGMRNHEEVREAIHSATVMALPCIIGQDGNRDALPTVLLEALAAGLPVVSTAIGGVEEIVDHGRAGLLVRAGDSVALAESLGNLLRDRALQQQLAANGRARAEQQFDLSTNTGRLRNWFATSSERAKCAAEVHA